jgi:hypothetical protein
MFAALLVSINVRGRTPDAIPRRKILLMGSLTGRAVSLMTEVVDDNVRYLEIPEKIEQHCRRLAQALIKPHGITVLNKG